MRGFVPPPLFFCTLPPTFVEADKTATGLQQAIFPGVGAGVLRTQPMQVISTTKGAGRHGFRVD